MTRESLAWPEVVAELSKKTCVCGAELRFFQTRGSIRNIQSGRSEAPFRFECLDGHTWQEWIEVPA